MPRFALALLVTIVIASSALAQVINGETPLDETSIAHEPHPRSAGDQAAPQTPPVDSTAAAPDRREPPPTVPRD